MYHFTPGLNGLIAANAAGARRLVEFFDGNIRNRNIRAPYRRTVRAFLT